MASALLRATLLLGLATSPLVGQAPAGAAVPAPAVAPPAGPTAGGASTSREPAPYVREVWRYTRGDADPMHPPSTLRDGSNLPPLVITGIMLSPTDPRLSRVALRLPSGERHVVGIGGKLPPSYVITAIEAHRVEVQFPQLGGMRRRWIERPKPIAPR